jgi:hypothetical protein
VFGERRLLRFVIWAESHLKKAIFSKRRRILRRARISADRLRTEAKWPPLCVTLATFTAKLKTMNAQKLQGITSQTLKIAVDTNALPPALDIFARCSRLLEQTVAPTMAYKILAMVSSHSASTDETRRKAGLYLNEFPYHLPENVVTHSEQSDWQALTDSLLAALSAESNADPTH